MTIQYPKRNKSSLYRKTTNIPHVRGSKSANIYLCRHRHSHYYLYQISYLSVKEKTIFFGWEGNIVYSREGYYACPLNAIKIKPAIHSSQSSKYFARQRNFFPNNRYGYVRFCRKASCGQQMYCSRISGLRWVQTLLRIHPRKAQSIPASFSVLTKSRPSLYLPYYLYCRDSMPFLISTRYAIKHMLYTAFGTKKNRFLVKSLPKIAENRVKIAFIVHKKAEKPIQTNRRKIPFGKEVTNVLELI